MPRECQKSTVPVVGKRRKCNAEQSNTNQFTVIEHNVASAYDSKVGAVGQCMLKWRAGPGCRLDLDQSTTAAHFVRASENAMAM